MNHPKVSVISTVYNGAPFIERALPSILAQTYSDFEYIIVDDGSQDDTLNLLNNAALQDNRLRIFALGRLGRTKALNFAVAQAKGSYIVQQDFDDVSFSNRLERQIQYLDEHPKVALVGGYYQLIDENRSERYIRMPPTDHKELVRAMARYIPFAHTMVTFRKSAWVQAGGYPELDDIEDLNLWISFVKLGWEVANIPEALGEHRVYANSFWHRSFNYRERQKKLIAANHRAIKELSLPAWMQAYPVSRTFYAYLPDYVKRTIRRTLGRSKEIPISIHER